MVYAPDDVPIAAAVRTKVAAGRRSVLEALDRKDDAAGVAVRDGMISLVMSPEQVLFVLWTHAILKLGRRVRLDEHDRIITIIPYMVPEEHFNNFTVIVPDTGTLMVRRTRNFRLPMTAWCLTVRHHFDSKLFAGPQPPGRYECIVCSEARAHSAPLHEPLEAEVFLCNGCLVPWHSACAQRPIFGARWSLSRSEPDGVSHVSFLCPVCGAASDTG